MAVFTVYMFGNQYIEALEWCKDNATHTVKTGGQGNLSLDDMIYFHKKWDTSPHEKTYLFEFTSDDDALMFRLRYC